MLVLLGSLARLVRDVFPISGFLCFDAFDQVMKIVLNQHSHQAHRLIHPLREVLTPFHIVVSLGET
jgi:hypothetical protein